LRKTVKTNNPIPENLPTDIMHSFAKIQQGMEIYLAYEMKKRNLILDQEAIKYTFRYLISAEQPPQIKQGLCSEIIGILKEEPCIINTFKQAMRIKTMLLGKTGIMTEGMNLRMNLLNLGIQISEDRSELPTPEEFVDMANRFYEDCKDRFGSE
jgi:hypothetical protein